MANSKGWFKERRRHQLARKGVKTKNKKYNKTRVYVKNTKTKTIRPTEQYTEEDYKKMDEEYNKKNYEKRVRYEELERYRMKQIREEMSDIEEDGYTYGTTEWSRVRELRTEYLRLANKNLIVQDYDQAIYEIERSIRKGNKQHKRKKELTNMKQVNGEWRAA